MLCRLMKCGLVALGVGFFAWSGAQATPVSGTMCFDSPGAGFGAMVYGDGGNGCSVGSGQGNRPNEFGLTPPDGNNDTQFAVETVLAYLFGAAVPITDSVTGLENNAPGFTFTPANITGNSTVFVELDQAWTFATVKSGSNWALIDVRGLTELELSTKGLLENPNNNKARNISHVGFWNPHVNGGPNGSEIPVPATILFLGAGLLGIGLVRRRRG